MLGASRMGRNTLQALRRQMRQADVTVAHGSTTLPACAIAGLGLAERSGGGVRGRRRGGVGQPRRGQHAGGADRGRSGPAASVATPIEGIVEVVLPGRTGELAHVEDDASLADGLRLCLERRVATAEPPPAALPLSASRYRSSQPTGRPYCARLPTKPSRGLTPTRSPTSGSAPRLQPGGSRITAMTGRQRCSTRPIA